MPTNFGRYIAVESPTRFALGLLAFNVIVLALITLLPDDPSKAMREGRAVTWISFFHLLSAAWIASTLFRLRVKQQGARTGYLWLLVSLGFAFLSLDEAFAIHEKIDVLIHNVFAITETAAADHIDDYIVGLYGLAGLIVLYVFRAELFLYRRYAGLFAAGFVFFALMVVLDIMSSDYTVSDMLSSTPESSRYLKQWFAALEDCAKVFGGAFFLITFLQCRKLARTFSS